MKGYSTRPFFLILLCFFLLTELHSQDCDSKFVSLGFKGSSFEKFTHAAFTPANELISASYMPDFNGAAHLAKYSRNGVPLWSNYYYVAYFNFYPPTFLRKIIFNDFVLTDDGGMVVAGQVERYLGGDIKQMALIAKIDRYGNVEWSRTYFPTNDPGEMSCSNIYKTTDGDFIVYLANDNGPSPIYNFYSFNRVIRFSAQGQIKWSTLLYTGDFDARGCGLVFKRGITQLADNKIVIGDAVYKSDRSNNSFKISDGRLHFLALNYANGKVEWESDYPYIIPPSDPFFVPDIYAIAKLPGGNLSFTTSLYLANTIDPSLTKKPVTITTNNNGVVQNVISYYTNPGSDLTIVDVLVTDPAGTKNILFNNAGTSVISSINPDGTVNSNKGYNGTYPPNCFAKSDRGYGIFMSDNNSLQFKMLLTDANGNNDCTVVPAQIQFENIPVINQAKEVVTAPMINTQADYKLYFADYEYPLKKKDEYPLERTIDCEEQVNCCKDFIDSLNITNVKICEGSSYTLPDNNIVRDSGTYYVVYKTAGGCDSITYYQLSIDKNIAALTLGNDSCLTGAGSVVLRAPVGFDNYNWMDNSSSSSSYTIYAPGVYWVNVANICGSKTDSINIYDECDFPVYMPTAFTPNGDNLNDYFGFPEQNRNRLIELKIFNRWGNLVFKTTKTAKKWDGSYKSIPLTTGMFVYYLVMEGLAGKRIVHKGTVMLIR